MQAWVPVSARNKHSSEGVYATQTSHLCELGGFRGPTTYCLKPYNPPRGFQVSHLSPTPPPTLPRGFPVCQASWFKVDQLPPKTTPYQLTLRVSRGPMTAGARLYLAMYASSAGSGGMSTTGSLACQKGWVTSSCGGGLGGGLAVDGGGGRGGSEKGEGGEGGSMGWSSPSSRCARQGFCLGAGQAGPQTLAWCLHVHTRAGSKGTSGGG